MATSTQDRISAPPRPHDHSRYISSIPVQDGCAYLGIGGKVPAGVALDSGGYPSSTILSPIEHTWRIIRIYGQGYTLLDHSHPVIYFAV